MFSSDNTPYEKVGKNEPVSIADDIPFEIPDSWEWCRLGMISTYAQTKKKINAKDANPEMWGLDLEDIEKGGRLLARLTVRERKAIGDKTYFEKGDILYSKLRPYLLKILIADKDGICTPEIVPFKVYGGIEPEYIVAYLQSPYVDSAINAATYGIKMPRAGTETMTSLLVPVPPLSEQCRIVQKLKELYPFIQKYDTCEQSLKTLNSDFPDQLKKSILQLAVQGKLVPQDSADEPASVLVERIRAEKERLITEGKIKRDKNESVIFRRDNSHYENRDGKERCINDEIPFDIPESWAWVRLSSVADLSLGKMLDKAKNKGALQPYLRNVNVRWGSFDFDDILQMRFTDDEDARYSVQSGDVIMCEGGEPGRCAVWEYTSKFKIQKALHRIRPYSMVSSHYLFLLFSLYAKNGCFSSLFTGTTIKHLPGIKLAQVLVPLPPSNEQVRIIDFANTVMIELEKLTLEFSL